jgi:hypothetical protein
LNVSLNNITDKGFEAFCKAIQLNKTLLNLNMKNNWIGWDGVQLLENAMTANSTLKGLNLEKQKNNEVDFGIDADPETEAAKLQDRNIIRQTGKHDNPHAAE